MKGRHTPRPKEGRSILRAPLDTSVLPIPLERIREDVGLYSDTSDDRTLTDVLLAAMEFVGDLAGLPVAPMSVTEYFDGFAARLKLRHGGMSSVAVRAILEGHQAFSAVSSGVVLDHTTDPAHVVVAQPFPLVSPSYANPVSVQYTVGAYQAEGGGYTPARYGAEQVNAAIRYYVRTVYEARSGEMPLPDNWERGVLNLLGTAAVRGL